MEIIFEQGSYKLLLRDKADQKSIELLKRTHWGTKKTVYQHLNTETNIEKVPNPFFFSLEKQGELIGTCCFSKRTASVNDQNYNVWYSRYFSIYATKQGGIFGHMILKHIRAYFEKQVLSPSIFYAYVDASNIRSQKLIDYLGFNNIRSFETLSFSRLYPKKDENVALLSLTDKSLMRGLLQEAYKDHICHDFDDVFFQEDYFILKRNGMIVAGIRRNMAHWIVRSLPGLSGSLIVKFLPYIPVISRLFNPKKFRFVAFDGVYSRVGYEKDFFILMESVCAISAVSNGLIWLDSGSSIYHRLKHSGDWGIMDKLKDNIPAHVVAAFKNISIKEQEQIRNCPVYISATDII